MPHGNSPQLSSGTAKPRRHQAACSTRILSSLLSSFFILSLAGAALAGGAVGAEEPLVVAVVNPPLFHFEVRRLLLGALACEEMAAGVDGRRKLPPWCLHRSHAVQGELQARQSPQLHPPAADPPRLTHPCRYCSAWCNAYMISQGRWLPRGRPLPRSMCTCTTWPWSRTTWGSWTCSGLSRTA